MKKSIDKYLPTLLKKHLLGMLFKPSISRGFFLSSSDLLIVYTKEILIFGNCYINTVKSLPFQLYKPSENIGEPLIFWVFYGMGG